MKELNENELYAHTLSEHIDNNAECLKRFMMIIAEAIPLASPSIYDLINEWHSINKTINEELKVKMLKLNN